MAFCRNCGNEYGEGAVVCTKCGCALGSVNQTKNVVKSYNSSNNQLFKILSILFIVAAALSFLDIFLPIIFYIFDGNNDFSSSIIKTLNILSNKLKQYSWTGSGYNSRNFNFIEKLAAIISYTIVPIIRVVSYVSLSILCNKLSKINLNDKK